MASLAGRSLVSSYKELLKLNNATLNSGVSASLQTVEDGFAGATALQLSSAGLASTGTLATTGDFSVNTNKFNVTASSGNTAVAGTLASVGDFSVNTNKFTVAAASGNTSVAGTLNVTGTSTLAAVGGTTGSFSQTLASTGDFSVNTNKFNVTAASGNTLVAGTLGVSGATSLSSTLGVTGATTLSSTLGVAGNLAINTDKFNVTASSGDTSVAGTLTVTGPGVTAYFNSTGAIRLPQGIDGQRPAGQAGMLRFNTGSQSFEGHNGTLWGAIGGSGSGGSSQYVRETFTATAGQTTFTVTGGYTPERIDVFQNGVKLVNGSGNDVTVTSGTNIVLATGAAAGDIIDVVGLASGNFAGPATAKRQNFTATANQTVFTVTGGYTPGQLDVFQNGTKLLNAVDVDVSNGSTFTLTTGANAGDSVEVVGFTAADTVSGTLKFQDGTAAAPSITSFNDTNTGIFFPSADTIAFSEGGAEAMRIDSSGRVGIGTASPSSLLHVAGGVGSGIKVYSLTVPSANSETSRIAFGDAVNDLNVAALRGIYESGSVGAGTYSGGIAFNTSSNNIGQERLRIDSSGNVGIGNTSPSNKLQVTASTPVSVPSAGSSSHCFAIGSSGFGIASGALNSGSGYIQATRWDGAAGIYNLLLQPNGGNVGIGTTGPQKELQINATEPTIRLEESGAGSKRLEFSVNSNAEAKIFANQSGGTLILGTVATERLRIDSSGNLLVGTTSNFSADKMCLNFTSSQNGLGVRDDSNSSGANYAVFRNSSNGIVGTISRVTTTNAVAYNTSSDQRLKSNIADALPVLDKLMDVKVRQFDWTEGNLHQDAGFIAQELAPVLSGIVTEGKTQDDWWQLDYARLTPYLVKAIQEQQVIINELKTKVAALEAA